MPSMIQVHQSRSNQFYSYPVFDLLIKDDLYSSSLTFRSIDIRAPLPGSLIAVFSVGRSAYIVESVKTDTNGIVEVNCVSAWEFLKRRSWKWYVEKDEFRPAVDAYIYYNFFEFMNRHRKYQMGFDWYSSIPFVEVNTVKLDQDMSVYDLARGIIAGKNFALVSRISDGVSKNNITEVKLDFLKLDENPSNNSIIGLNSVKASFTRQLPESPTHWKIIDTSDSGRYKVSSRGDIRTWRQNHAYMHDSEEYTGPYLYETVIPGDPKVGWGPLTVDIKPEKLNTSVIDIDNVTSEYFNKLTIGSPVSLTAFDLYITGYVTERTVSGGQNTNYSIKIQPNRFYDEGEDITRKWI